MLNKKAIFRQTMLILPMGCLIAMNGACDKGMASLQKGEEKFANVLNQELSESNLQDAVSLAMLYKITMKAHVDESSGKEAQKKLEELQKRASTKKATFEKELEKLNEPVVNSGLELDKLVRPIDEKVRNFKRDILKPRAIKTGDCLAYDFSSEFDKRLPYERLKIRKVARVGKEEALVEEIYSGSMGELQYPTEALAKSRDQTPEQLYSLERPCCANQRRQSRQLI